MLIPTWSRPERTALLVVLCIAACDTPTDDDDAPDLYAVGAMVSGLDGTVVLQNNGADDLSSTADGPVTFATRLPTGSAYNVTVLTQPAGQTCTVTGGSGVVATANVTSVQVACTTNTYSIGGTMTGLVGVGCVLQNNGGDDLALATDGAFAFPTRLPTGTAYAATVFAQPIGPTQTCAVTNGAGAVADGDVTDIAVSCTVDRPACDTYTDLGSIAGDVTSGAITVSGAGEAWFRVRLTEQNNGDVDLSAAVELTVPASIDYDLHVYCGACGGALAGSSASGTGAAEGVVVGWEDSFAASDDGEVLVHVAYSAGSSGESWTLQVRGAQPGTNAFCPF